MPTRAMLWGVLLALQPSCDKRSTEPSPARSPERLNESTPPPAPGHDEVGCGGVGYRFRGKLELPCPVLVDPRLPDTVAITLDVRCGGKEAQPVTLLIDVEKVPEVVKKFSSEQDHAESLTRPTVPDSLDASTDALLVSIEGNALTVKSPAGDGPELGTLELTAGGVMEALWEGDDVLLLQRRNSVERVTIANPGGPRSQGSFHFTADGVSPGLDAAAPELLVLNTVQLTADKPELLYAVVAPKLLLVAEPCR